MLNVSSYALQYGNVNAAAVAARQLGLFITEGGPLGGTAALSDAEVAALVAAGTRVVGYVDSCVTDSGRPYWNPAWTSDGTDTGMPTAAAPAWLAGGVGIDFTGDGASDGYVTDFTDAGWRAIVVAQAVDLVARGYSGVFLDDITQYFHRGLVTGNIQQLATSMLELVVEIDTAIRAVNPDAVIVTNGSPFVIFDAVGGGTSAASQAFVGVVDAMLLESYFGVAANYEGGFIDVAVANIAPHAQLLALEFGGDASQNHHFLANAAARGIVGFAAPTAAYDSLDAPVAAPTVGNDSLHGTRAPDRLDGLAGADTMRGEAGDDVYIVDRLGDLVIENAGAGTDRVEARVNRYALPDNVEQLVLGAAISHGNGNDAANRLTGNALGNVMQGREGEDVLIGLGGADTLYGNADNDELEGGEGKDVLLGGGGADQFVYGADVVGGRYDVIADFSRAEGDRIDLSAIDALAGGGDDAFAFVTGAGFAAGQVKVRDEGDFLLVRFFCADASGAIVQTSIRVTGEATLTAADFIL